MKPTVSFNKFLDRQRDPTSPLTTWTIPDYELLARIATNWDSQRPGYRDGVILVPIDPTGFLGAIRVLMDGDKLVGVYQPRCRERGELPRKHFYFDGKGLVFPKSTPVSVDVVLYHKDVLAESDEVIDTDWSVITILGKLCGPEMEEPMPPETLMANHFQDSGGTATGMTPEQFQEALRKSYFYWRDKAPIQV